MTQRVKDMRVTFRADATKLRHWTDRLRFKFELIDPYYIRTHQLQRPGRRRVTTKSRHVRVGGCNDTN